MWLYLRPHFKIVPYFLFHIPGLSYVESSLAYYEDYFEQHIYRMPHPALYDMFTTGAYQPVHRVSIIDGMRLPQFEYADIEDILCARLKLGKIFSAVGMRTADNIQRYTMITQVGPLGFKRRRWYYAIWDWNVAQVSEIIKRHGVKLAPEYSTMGRTIASFQYQELRALKDNYPADFEKFREWFPLIDLEFFRYEQVGKNSAAQV